MRSLLLTICLVAAGLSLPDAAVAAPVAAPTSAADLAAAAERIQAEAGAHRLILLGEKHGTRETPALVSVLVSKYAAKEPVVLALELDAGLSRIFDTYLRSDGGAQARAELLAWPYWHVEAARSDGRRNLALIALLEDVRALRARGADVEVIGMDNAPTGPADRPARNPAMAERVRKALAGLPNGRLLLLSGNAHTMKERPSYAPPEMSEPMGAYLADLDPYAVDIVARGGSAWACDAGMQHCGPMAQPAGFESSERLPAGDVFDLRVVLPSFSVAPMIPGASAQAQAEEFFRLLESEPDHAWLEDSGDEWIEQLSAASRIAIAERAMKQKDPMVRAFGPIQYYAMGMDERGDSAFVDLSLDGVAMGGLAWGWIHSGDATLMDRRMAGIRRILLARYDTLTPVQRKRADELLEDSPAR